MYGPLEIYDARQEEPWRQLDFADDDWQQAFCLNASEVVWEKLVPREIPQRCEKTIRPTAIVKTGEVLNQEYAPAMHGGLVNNLATFFDSGCSGTPPGNHY